MADATTESAETATEAAIEAAIAQHLKLVVRWHQAGHIKPAIMERIERCLVGELMGLDEHEQLRANSYEREALVPFLTDEAFIAAFARIRKNTFESPHRPHTTYEQALAGLYGQEAERRMHQMMQQRLLQHQLLKGCKCR